MRGLITAIVVLCIVVGPFGLVAAQSGLTVGVDAPDSVADGSSVSADLEATGVTDPEGVGSYTVNVTYDPAVVSVSASSTSTFTVSTSEPSSGVLRIAGYTGDHPGPTGDVVVASLTITGTANGSSNLATSVESITDADGNELTNSTSTDSITVTETSSSSSSSSSSNDTSSTEGTPDISVVDASLSATELAPGEAVTVTAALHNNGDASGSATVELAVDGVGTGDTATVQLRADEGTDVTFTTQFDSEGEYTLSVDGVTAGTVTVTDGAMTTTADETDDGESPDSSDGDDGSTTTTQSSGDATTTTKVVEQGVPEPDSSDLPLGVIGGVAVVAVVGGALYVFFVKP